MSRFRFGRALGLALAAASLTLAAQPAAAAIMLVTRTSVITGVQNGVSADLIGETFTLTLKYDTAKGKVSFPREGQPDVEFQGNPGEQALLSASFSFGEFQHTFVAPPGVFALEQLPNSEEDDEYGLGFLPPGDATVGFLLSLRGGSDTSLPLDFAAPLFARTVDDGIFAFALADGSQGTIELGDEITRNGTLRVEELSAAVPEPATWALMITGFGLAGRALRTRRRQLTLA